MLSSWRAIAIPSSPRNWLPTSPARPPAWIAALEDFSRKNATPHKLGLAPVRQDERFEEAIKTDGAGAHNGSAYALQVKDGSYETHHTNRIRIRIVHGRIGLTDHVPGHNAPARSVLAGRLCPQ